MPRTALRIMFDDVWKEVVAWSVPVAVFSAFLGVDWLINSFINSHFADPRHVPDIGTGMVVIGLCMTIIFFFGVKVYYVMRNWHRDASIRAMQERTAERRMHLKQEVSPRTRRRTLKKLRPQRFGPN